MKVLMCTPYLESPDVVSSGIGTWARNVIAYNQMNRGDINIVPVSFDRHTHIEDHTVGGIKRYYSGLVEVGRSLLNAIRQIRRERPDVVHICTSGSLAFLKDIILTSFAKRKGIKSIVHLHFGRVPDILKDKGWECRLLRTLLGMVDLVITMDSESFRALSEQNYRNIVFVPNPISDAFLQSLEEQKTHVGREHKRAIFVGHVVATKGLAELVEGCSKIAGLKLRIIGKCSEEMKEKLISLAKERDNEEWLTILGEIPHSEVVREMLEADTFVFPSYTEGFPNVILEAMACGCCIAASRVGAIPEMLDSNGEAAGLCFNPMSSDAVAQAVDTLYRDDELRNRLSERAREKVYCTYTMKQIWPQLIQLWSTKYSNKDNT